MLRLPAALIEDISLRAGQLDVLSKTCSALCRLLNQPETQLRFYLNSGSCQQRRRRLLLSGPAAACTTSSSSSGNPQQQQQQHGPATVYGLLACCRARCADGDAPPQALRLLQLLLACCNMIQLVPGAAQQEAVQQLVALVDSAAAPEATRLLLEVLPCAEHCLLPFAAASGHLQLVELLLPLSRTAPLSSQCGTLHYVRTSAFLAAAAGGHARVVSQLLAAGATQWACQLPGASLTQSALDLAVLGGHVQVMQLLGQHCRNPSALFLTAAADSGSGGAMECALQQWFGQFNAVTAYCRAHTMQLHDALRVACQRGHVSAVRQLLAALHRTNYSLDCGVLALGYASSTCNTDAIAAVLDSAQLSVQLARGGPKLRQSLALALGSCLRIAILKHNRAALDLLLKALTSSSAPAAVARPLLAPQMPSIFDQAASSGNTSALQLLLLMLPEHFEALGVSALEAALSEGHADAAAMIRSLLAMQCGGPDAAAAAGLTPEGNTGLARASLAGAYKAACVRGDVAALQALLAQGSAGPDDNVQLLLLRLAAGAGREGAVRLLLDAFGGAGPRLEANLRAVCRGAAFAGELRLLQSLARDSPSPLLSHLASQPEALAEYLRAALLCGQVDVAAWLVLRASERQQMDLVRHTLVSLLATSRWELLNAGRGVSAQHTVFQLLRRLAAQQEQQQQQAAGQGPVTAGEEAAASAGADGGAGAGAPSAAAPAGDGSAATSSATSTSTGAHGSSDAAQPAGTTTPCTNLGRQLLHPQLLGLLLHASQGNPGLLLEICELLQGWGLYDAGSGAAAAAAAASAAGEATAAKPGRGAKHSGAAASTSSSASGSLPSSGHSSSTITASSSSSSAGSTGECGHERHAGAAAAASSGGTHRPDVMLTSSLESGSNNSDEYPATWLSDLPGSCWGSAGGGCGGLSAGGGGGNGCGSALDQLLGQSDAQLGCLRQQEYYFGAAAPAQSPSPAAASPAPAPTAAAPKVAAAAAAGPGHSWFQQLAGQVAALKMSSPLRSAEPEPAATQQQQEQHQQPRASPWQQQGQLSLDVDHARPRRESCPTQHAAATAVDAQQRLRPTASQPLPQQARSPVHPYMRASMEAQQSRQEGQRGAAAAGPAGSSYQSTR